MGKKQTCYLVMGTPFLLNEMIAGGVPELWRSLHSLWLASCSPETPGGGTGPRRGEKWQGGPETRSEGGRGRERTEEHRCG